ncbi:MAG: hypothetical protein RIE59_20690 [Imperialibacter sp.]
MTQSSTDTIFYDTLIVPIDTLTVFDSIFVVAPDSLFLADLDSTPIRYEYVEVTSEKLNEIDSMNYSSPDSLYLFDFDHIIQVDSVMTLDTVAKSESTKRSHFYFCLEEATQKTLDFYTKSSAFLSYVTGNWRSSDVLKCAIGDDVSSQYSNFVVRFDVVEFNATSIRLSYLSAFGQPILMTKGTIDISADTDFSSETIVGTRDNGKIIRFENLVNNINSTTLECTLEDVFECGDDGGRLFRLGTAKLRCDKF